MTHHHRDLPRIAWFSPLPRSSSGGESSSVGSPHEVTRSQGSTSAYLSEVLLPLLRSRFEIEVFAPIDEHRIDAAPPTVSGVPVSHYLSAFKRHERAPFDLFFYQLEDSRATAFARMHLGLLPGVVYLHDFLLSDDGPEPILNSPWSEVVAKYHDGRPWPDRAREYTKLGPHALRESGLALRRIFSCPRMHREYRAGGSPTLTTPSHYLPLPVRISNPRESYASYRAVAFCGTPRIEHRAHKVLQGVREAGEDLKLLWLIDSAESDAARSLAFEYELSNVEFIFGRSPARWESVVQEAEVALHPLFSVYGQTGPYLPISMMAGVPVVVTDFGSAEYLSSQVVCKVAPGEGESGEITAWLRELRNPALRATLGQRARGCAVELHSATVIASELAHIFERSLIEDRGAMRRWRDLERSAAESVVAEAETLMGGDAVLSDRWSLLCAQTFEELGWTPR